MGRLLETAVCLRGGHKGGKWEGAGGIYLIGAWQNRGQEGGQIKKTEERRGKSTASFVDKCLFNSVCFF